MLPIPLHTCGQKRAKRIQFCHLRLVQILVCSFPKAECFLSFNHSFLISILRTSLSHLVIFSSNRHLSSHQNENKKQKKIERKSVLFSAKMFCLQKSRLSNNLTDRLIEEERYKHSKINSKNA